jgi:hypothetical protein
MVMYVAQVNFMVHSPAEVITASIPRSFLVTIHMEKNGTSWPEICTFWNTVPF